MSSKTSPSRLSALIEHRLRTAPSPKQAAATRVPQNEPARIQVWAPLIGFQWIGDERKISTDTEIRLGSRYTRYSENGIASFLSRDEEAECRDTRHWLWFTQSAHSRISVAANMNAFLFSLWVARPTPTHVRVRFHHGDSGDHGVARVLERFTWIGSQVVDTILDADLGVVSRIFPEVRAVYLDTERLRSALVFSFRGCLANDWRTAFLCFAAAAAGLLRHSGRGALAKRISAGYSKLTCTSKQAAQDVNSRQAQLEHLYRFGARILEGRTSQQSSPENLAALASLSDSLRLLWGTILDSRELIAALEQDDEGRRRFFAHTAQP